MNENKNRWWYRLSKVAFWLVFICVFVTASAVSWEENKPYSYAMVDDDASYIQCNKHKEEDLIYPFNKNFFSTNSSGDDLTVLSKDRAKELCSQLNPQQKLLLSREETRLIEGGIWNSDERSALLETYKTKILGDTGYVVHIDTETINEGSYKTMALYQTVILLVTLIAMYLISSIFKYVLFGEKFKVPFK
ncbi:hypothetical protein KW782_03230 [Candidatus Parcubacteria bacterium]|nr:hypothetical protein [Candidatus Parcubacteria bacterium]